MQKTEMNAERGRPGFGFRGLEGAFVSMAKGIPRDVGLLLAGWLLLIAFAILVILTGETITVILFVGVLWTGIILYVKRIDWLVFLLCTSLVGYSIFQRTFSYLGLAQYNLFVGELILIVVGFLALPRLLNTCQILAHWTSVLHWQAIWLLYGILSVVALSWGQFPFHALAQGFMLHHYTLYLLVGTLIGMRLIRWSTIKTTLRTIIVLNAVYGAAYVALLSRLEGGLTLPGSPGVALFPQPAASALSLLVLVTLNRVVAFPKVLFWSLLFLNTAVMVAIQVRGEILFLLVGMFTWLLLTKKLKAWLQISFATFIILFVLGLLKVQIPGPRGPISTAHVIARFVSLVSVPIAERLIEDPVLAGIYVGTFDWRVTWWKAVVQHSLSSPQRFLFGEGHGFMLAHLVGYRQGDEVGALVHTTHNFAVDILGHLGLIGLILFSGFLWSIVKALRSFRRLVAERGTYVHIMAFANFGFAFFFASLALALVGNVLGTPFGAIPFYFLTGLILGLMLRSLLPENLWQATPSPSFLQVSAVRQRKQDT